MDGSVEGSNSEAERPTPRGVERLVVPVDATINQCDGCLRGLPMVDGIHKGEGYDMICCTKHLYTQRLK